MALNLFARCFVVYFWLIIANNLVRNLSLTTHCSLISQKGLWSRNTHACIFPFIYYAATAAEKIQFKFHISSGLNVLFSCWINGLFCEPHEATSLCNICKWTENLPNRVFFLIEMMYGNLWHVWLKLGSQLTLRWITCQGAFTWTRICIYETRAMKSNGKGH